MLITLFLWLIYTCLFYLYGAFLSNSTGCTESNEAWFSGVIRRILIGMGLCTGLAMAFSLILPLERWPFLMVMAGAAVYAVFLLRQKHHKQFVIDFSSRRFGFVPVFALQLIAFLFILVNTQVQPANPDTSLYHAQAVRWSEEYRAVPGLIHLHSRLAYNSSWLVLNALLSFSWITGTSYHVLAGFFFWITLVSLTSSAGKLITNGLQFSRLFSLAVIPLVFIAQSYSQCWYEPFPCVPHADGHTFLRGESLLEGFISQP